MVSSSRYQRSRSVEVWKGFVMYRQDNPQESHLRSILKAVTYRIAGTVTTFAITFTITNDLVIAMAIGGVEPAVKMVVYYVHERAWQKVPHGSIRKRWPPGIVRIRRNPR